MTGLLVFWGATTANPLITVFSLLMPPVLALLLWREGEPPVLLFACGMQWLQAAAGIFYQNTNGQTLEQAFNGPELAQATWLSLIGVLVLALGMRAALMQMHGQRIEGLEQEALTLSPPRLFSLYLIFLAAFTFVRAIAFRFPAFTQALMAATSLQWIPVILLAEAVLTQRTNYGLLALVVAIEFATGLLGYFSNFKSVFFILAVLLLASPGRLSRSRWAGIGAIALFLLVTNCAWTAIKMEYREFLNQGSGQQIVLVPVKARLQKLNQLVSDLDRQKLADGFEVSLQRVSYVTFFAHCIANVPQNVPYENGALWWGAVVHTFTPRLFFPNKPTLDDSQRTQKYTGLSVAGREEGASIGLGYMAESYIDFGSYFMFAPVFLLGVFFGLTYRLFAFRKRHRLLGMACAIAILIFGAYEIETSNVKLVGGNTMSVLVLGLFYWRFGPAFYSSVTRLALRPAGATARNRTRTKTQRVQGPI